MKYQSGGIWKGGWKLAIYRKSLPEIINKLEVMQEKDIV